MLNKRDVIRFLMSQCESLPIRNESDRINSIFRENFDPEVFKTSLLYMDILQA